jgi:16S rRNA (cytosine967-C5)-methyltransferase
VRVEKPREIAVRLLSRRPEAGTWLDDELAWAGQQARLSLPDRALLHELTLGAVRQQALLDWLIARRTDDRPQPLILRNLLRVGLYQMFLLDRIPDHAAVNETVELAKRLGFASQAGFVNALLRGCLRERDKLEQALQALKDTQPDIGFSHPRWLCERWERNFGAERMRALLDWNNRAPELYARVNTLRLSPAKLQEQWAGEGVEWSPTTFDWVPDGGVMKMMKHPSLASLASFRQGGFYVQDPSTLLAVKELGAVPGESILDLCAAPGGKTTAIAQSMKNEGSITAFDPEPSRRGLIRENCERLGVTMVRVPEGVPVRPGERFARILVDTPCSNTGVMRRRAELRWRITEPEIERLHREQIGLLRQARDWLKPGGILVYSTCSLEPEENEDVVREFLASVGGCELLRQRQVTPWVEQVDGAYVAVLRRSRSLTN